MICYPDLNLSIKSNPNSSEMEESIIGFLVANRNSIRGFVRRSVGRSVGRLVRWSRVFFDSGKRLCNV